MASFSHVTWVTCARAAAAGALVVSIVPMALACDDAAKREARALVAAVDQYAKADDGARSQRAQAVVAVECSAAEVCAARQACLAAISPTVRALALKDEVAARVAEMEGQRAATDASGPADATGLAAKLDEAERLLKEGHAGMEACEKGVAGLRVKYGG